MGSDDKFDVWATTTSSDDLNKATYEMWQAGQNLASLHLKADAQRIKVQQAINELRHADQQVVHGKDRYKSAIENYRQALGGESPTTLQGKPVYSSLLSGKPYDTDHVERELLKVRTLSTLCGNSSSSSQ